jgi:hypothetical protein
VDRWEMFPPGDFFPRYHPHPPQQNESCTSINSDKVLNKLKDLRPDSAPGPDKIHPRLLKEMRYELAEPLCIIFKKSIHSCSVPADWKTAIVTPIFKKGAKADPGNYRYRPVSLTSVPCKVMESIIKDEIMSHLANNNLPVARKIVRLLPETVNQSWSLLILCVWVGAVMSVAQF